MISSGKYIENEDPIIQIRCIRDNNAKKYKTTKELLDYLDKTLSPDEFLAKLASGEITEEDIQIPEPDDEIVWNNY